MWPFSKKSSAPIQSEADPASRADIVATMATLTDSLDGKDGDFEIKVMLDVLQRQLDEMDTSRD